MRFPRPPSSAKRSSTWAEAENSGSTLVLPFGELPSVFSWALQLAPCWAGLPVTYWLARKLLDPLLQSLRNIPSMAWVPLFLLWMGIQETSKIALIALGAFFPVYLNLSSGMSHVDPKLIEVGKVYRLTGFQMVRRVILPAALPEYIVGLRSGLSLAWMFVVAAEIMGASRGLGFLMIDGQMTGTRLDHPCQCDPLRRSR